jgi:hypothetical protein
MSDDFGTVNARRGERSREIEVLREHYRTHREALVRMSAEAPTEHLAAEYHRLIAEIDHSLRKLDELEATPGQRPLVLPTDTTGTYDATPGPDGSSSRIILIVLAGLVVLGAIAWMIWRASSDRRTPDRPVVEQTATTTTTTDVPAETGTVVPAVTPVPIAAAASIQVTPAVQDYGIIRRGTRAVREFELTNTGETPVTITVARSACRCLYYAFNSKQIPPKARETITVTVDAARAKSTTVDEQLSVTAKEDPSATATIGVRAEIR